jgi:hypothetical protein
MYTVTLFGIVLLPGTVQASGQPWDMPGWVYGVEYLAPTKPGRDLSTVNFDLFYAFPKPNRTLQKSHLSLYTGLTASRVTGTITQLTGSYEEGTLKNTTFESSANGIGPVFLLRFDALHQGRSRFFLDASHGILFFDRPFPTGGDRYNGLRRLGASLSYRMDATYTLNIGYRWMHGSNGKGVNPRNPAYEGRGANIQLGVAY